MKNRITKIFEGKEQTYYEEVCTALLLLLDSDLATLTFGEYDIPDKGVVEDFGYIQSDDQYAEMNKKYKLDLEDNKEDKFDIPPEF